MKLQSKKITFLAGFLILFLIPLHSAEFEINFIETFDENYMLEVIQELKYENNIKRIKTFLDQKHWIERYEIKKKPKVFLRKMKSRWGSCSNTGRINLNTDLVKVPKRYIDYVIIHELCHLKEPNHSPRFYRLLRQPHLAAPDPTNNTILLVSSQSS